MSNPQDLLFEMTTLWMSSLLVANARLARMWLPATAADRADLWNELVAEKADAATKSQLAAAGAIFAGLDATGVARASLGPIRRKVDGNLREITRPKSCRKAVR